MKAVRDLAVFGAPPLFAEPMHVGRPNVPDRAALLRHVEDILDRRWFTNDGACVRELEHHIAERIGVRHCVATCNGTIALQIAIRALGLTGEVIVPSLTFVATAHALAWQGITPVFCDVDPESCTLDPFSVEQAITARTTGILGVHLWGRTCDTDALARIARRHGVALLYDAAHAFGCTRDGRNVGTFGRAEVFSFHATKFFSTFEGGAIVTDDDALAERLRLMRNFGFAGFDEVACVGTNGKMCEVAAAMGLVSLDGLDGVLAVNRANHERYRARLAGVPGVRVIGPSERERTNHQYVVLELDPETTGIARDRVVDVLWAENVVARRYFHPGCHRMEPYRSSDPGAGRWLPVTERLVERVLTLPTGTAASPQAVDAICALLHRVLRDGPRIAAALAARADGDATRRACA